MPNTELKTRPAVKALKPTPGKTIFYSDPDLKADPDARGIRLSVGATTKTWMLTKRIDGKVRNIALGHWPDLPTIYAARDKAKEKKEAVVTRTDAESTGIKTLDDAIESHILNSTGSTDTHEYYRSQINRHLSDLFKMDIEKVTLADIEDAVRPHLRMIEGKRRASSTAADYQHGV